MADKDLRWGPNGLYRRFKDLGGGVYAPVVSVGDLTVTVGDVGVTSLVPGTAATNLGKAEDAVHASGDVGVMALAVRKDTAVALGANGDYVPLTTDATGNLRVTSKTPADVGTPSNTQSSTANQTLLSSNASRYGFKIYNDGVNPIYVKYGATATTTSYTYLLPGHALLEEYEYTGRVDAIWAVDNGTDVARTTELTHS
jgi:hypothetical protein